MSGDPSSVPAWQWYGVYVASFWSVGESNSAIASMLRKSSSSVAVAASGTASQSANVLYCPHALAAELLFPRLSRGETLALEYHLAAEEQEAYIGRWFRGAGQRFEMTLRFAPEVAVKQVYRIWRLDSGAPHKDVA